MRILLINDTDGRRNIGCQLTSVTLKRSLAQTFGALGTRIETVPAPWRFGKRFDARDPSLSRAIRRRDGLFGRDALRALAEAEYGAESLAELERCDAAIFQPEGTISDSHDSARILRNLSLPLYILLHGRVPLGVLNGSFPLFGDHRARLIGGLLGSADAVALRDRLSAEFWDLPFCPDSALCYSARAVEGGNALLITTAAEATPTENLALAHEALAVCRTHGLRPLVLTKDFEHLEPLRDRVAALGGAFRGDATLAQAEALLRPCRAHIGGRYHMALLCALMGIPSVLIRSNTHKNLWLAHDFNGITVAADIAETGKMFDALPVAPDTALRHDVQKYRALHHQAMHVLCAALMKGRGAGATPQTAETWLEDGSWQEIGNAYTPTRFSRWRRRLRLVRR